MTSLILSSHTVPCQVRKCSCPLLPCSLQAALCQGEGRPISTNTALIRSLPAPASHPLLNKGHSSHLSSRLSLPHLALAPSPPPSTVPSLTGPLHLLLEPAPPCQLHTPHSLGKCLLSEHSHSSRRWPERSRTGPPTGLCPSWSGFLLLWT